MVNYHGNGESTILFGKPREIIHWNSGFSIAMLSLPKGKPPCLVTMLVSIFVPCLLGFLVSMFVPCWFNKMLGENPGYGAENHWWWRLWRQAGACLVSGGWRWSCKAGLPAAGVLCAAGSALVKANDGWWMMVLWWFMTVKPMVYDG